MQGQSRRIRREKRTIDAMVAIYCKARHRSPGRALCAECAELLKYAHGRLDRCRYGASKPTCGNCPIHCYAKHMKARVIRVMSYSGPRMTLRHPYYAFMHLLDGFRKAPKGNSPT